MPGTRASWNGASTPLGEKPSSSMRRSSSYCLAIHESMNSRRRSFTRSRVAASMVAARGPLRRSTEQHVLEELSRAPASTTIHMPRDALFEDEPGVTQDGRIEVLRVVDDDEDTSVARKLCSGVVKHSAHCFDIGAERRAAASS